MGGGGTQQTEELGRGPVQAEVTAQGSSVLGWKSSGIRWGWGEGEGRLGRSPGPPLGNGLERLVGLFNHFLIFPHYNFCCFEKKTRGCFLCPKHQPFPGIKRSPLGSQSWQISTPNRSGSRPHVCFTLTPRIFKKINTFDLCQNTLDLPAEKETICTGGNVSIPPKWLSFLLCPEPNALRNLRLQGWPQGSGLEVRSRFSAWPQGLTPPLRPGHTGPRAAQAGMFDGLPEPSPPRSSLAV